jgi:hypothetical protein
VKLDLSCIKKGDIVKTTINEEPVWCEVTGFHHPGLQARVGTPLDCKMPKVGDFVKIELDDVQDILGKGPCDND